MPRTVITIINTATGASSRSRWTHTGTVSSQVTIILTRVPLEATLTQPLLYVHEITGIIIIIIIIISSSSSRKVIVVIVVTLTQAAVYVVGKESITVRQAKG